MGVFDLDWTQYALVDDETQVKSASIGLVAEREFERARTEIVELAAYSSYRDWLDAREGLQIGLSMAGVEATTVCVSLSAFLRWRALTGASCDERALDAFAALVSTVRGADGLRVLAVVGGYDFATHPLQAAALAGRRDYRDWLRHRRSMRAEAIADGLHVEELPIRLDGFAEWSACLRQSACEAALDRYAHLLLEHLTSEIYAPV
jgi:hypothetical protein